MTLRPVPPGSLLKEPLEKRPRRKTPVEKRPGNDFDYLTMIRELPCTVCRAERYRSEAHHLKCTGERGMAKKSSDKWAVPLCWFHHDEVERAGSRNEEKWFKERGIDCLTLAAALYSARHSLDAMRRVLDAH